jgi:hypothetical protein
MFGTSALARLAFGHRLLSEAVVVGVTLAVSTFLVFRLVRSLTASTTAAVLSAMLLIVAGVRGYSYPKVFIYAVAATMWWAYVREPTRLKILALGAWVAAAFYWRVDHGIYVAAGVALAVVTAHGLSRVTATRLAQAAAASLVALLPFSIFVASTVGFDSYGRDGLTIVNNQHTQTSEHTWPKWPIRRVSDVIRLDGPEEFAPTVSLRWAEDSSPEARARVLAKYGLTPVAGEGPPVQVVRLPFDSVSMVRALINEPVVADTAGIDRSRSEVEWSTWPIWQRARFSHWWLRFGLLTGVDEQGSAGEAVAALFYSLPLIVVVAAIPWLRRYLPARTTAVALVGFGLFGIVTAFGLMRSPYDVRAVDDVVVPAILSGCGVAALWRTALATRGVRRGLLAIAAVMFAVLMIKSVAVAGQFGDRVAWLTGEGRSVSRMAGAWREVRDRLVAQPALAYWNGIPKGPELQLAQYAAECLPSSKRLLVLWFAPEIYYYADRLMAARHLFFDSGYEKLAQEQRLTLDKIQRFAPPLVFASGGLDTHTRELYPAIVDYVHREYETVGAVEDNGQRYQVLMKRNEPAVRVDSAHGWPCLS